MRAPPNSRETHWIAKYSATHMSLAIDQVLLYDTTARRLICASSVEMLESCMQAVTTEAGAHEFDLAQISLLARIVEIDVMTADMLNAIADRRVLSTSCTLATPKLARANKSGSLSPTLQHTVELIVAMWTKTLSFAEASPKDARRDDGLTREAFDAGMIPFLGACSLNTSIDVMCPSTQPLVIHYSLTMQVHR